MFYIYRLSVIILCFLSLKASQAQIKTIQLFNPQTNDHTPIINIGEHLIFSFDELNKNFQNYDYKIIRYDKNWKASNAFTSEFLKGMDRNRIKNYKNSFNTRVKYTHYEVEIPNKDFNFTLSGNYAIQVLKPYSNTPVIEKRFYVVQPMATIGVAVNRVSGGSDKNQRVQVTVNSQSLDFFQSTDYEVSIFKNNNFHNAVTLENATFTKPHQLVFQPMNKDFKGGAEFNFFDTKNLEAPALTTEKIVKDSIYHTILYPDTFTPNAPYTEQPDIDGDYYIRSAQLGATNPANNADYTNVYFALGNYTPKNNEQICIYGAFNNFTCNGSSILKYNPETHLWETHLLLKQGYYNYSYATKTHNGIEDTKVTGSYWQTENKYTALFYIQPWGQRYTLLVGYGVGYSKPPYR